MGRLIVVLVLQRCISACVNISGRLHTSIKKGLVLFLGVEKTDKKDDVDKILKKVLGLRVFNDKNNKINLSIRDVNGSILLISQFTLCADLKSGKRPGFTKAAKSEEAEIIYNYFIDQLKKGPIKYETGVFGATMDVSLINDGPFTLILNSDIN